MTSVKKTGGSSNPQATKKTQKKEETTSKPKTTTEPSPKPATPAEAKPKAQVSNQEQAAAKNMTGQSSQAEVNRAMIASKAGSQAGGATKKTETKETKTSSTTADSVDSKDGKAKAGTTQTATKEAVQQKGNNHSSDQLDPDEKKEKNGFQKALDATGQRLSETGKVFNEILDDGTAKMHENNEKALDTAIDVDNNNGNLWQRYKAGAEVIGNTLGTPVRLAWNTVKAGGGALATMAAGEKNVKEFWDKGNVENIDPNKELTAMDKTSLMAHGALETVEGIGDIARKHPVTVPAAALLPAAGAATIGTTATAATGEVLLNGAATYATYRTIDSLAKGSTEENAQVAAEHFKDAGGSATSFAITATAMSPNQRNFEATQKVVNSTGRYLTTGVRFNNPADLRTGGPIYDVETGNISRPPQALPQAAPYKTVDVKAVEVLDDAGGFVSPTASTTTPANTPAVLTSTNAAAGSSALAETKEVATSLANIGKIGETASPIFASATTAPGLSASLRPETRHINRASDEGLTLSPQEEASGQRITFDTRRNPETGEFENYNFRKVDTSIHGENTQYNPATGRHEQVDSASLRPETRHINRASDEGLTLSPQEEASGQRITFDTRRNPETGVFENYNFRKVDTSIHGENTQYNPVTGRHEQVSLGNPLHLGDTNSTNSALTSPRGAGSAPVTPGQIDDYRPFATREYTNTYNFDDSVNAHPINPDYDIKFNKLIEDHQQDIYLAYRDTSIDITTRRETVRNTLNELMDMTSGPRVRSGVPNEHAVTISEPYGHLESAKGDMLSVGEPTGKTYFDFHNHPVDAPFSNTDLTYYGNNESRFAALSTPNNRYYLMPKGERFDPNTMREFSENYNRYINVKNNRLFNAPDPIQAQRNKVDYLRDHADEYDLIFVETTTTNFVTNSSDPSISGYYELPMERILP